MDWKGESAAQQQVYEDGDVHVGLHRDVMDLSEIGFDGDSS